MKTATKDHSPQGRRENGAVDFVIRVDGEDSSFTATWWRDMVSIHGVLVPAKACSFSIRARSKEVLWPTTSRSVSGPKGMRWASNYGDDGGWVSLFASFQRQSLGRRRR
jgi:hypothetical protein